jgi:DNA polymerase III delta prime subunit
MTLQSYNSCLKFFEEPGVQNIVLLTNNGESGIIETILSRVQSIDLKVSSIQKSQKFYCELISNYLEKKSTEIFSYFFRNKLEKSDYIDFLQAIIEL